MGGNGRWRRHVRGRQRGPRAGLPLLPVLLLLALVCAPTSGAAERPTGFSESVVFSGLTNPSAVRFAQNGRVFVAEKSGRIVVYDGLSDTTPTLFADLSTNVHNYWDRGLLGLALDPGFPSRPYVYVLYTHDAAIGGVAPRWGTPGVLTDSCPTPPGPTGDGCVVSARLSRLEAAGDVMTGPERVLVEDWCQQYPSHSIGSLAFGPDGALYVTGGDGASFNFADYGQDGSPPNPCGDPPGPPGSLLSPPTAEGGALRSQDLRTGGDPVGLDGAVLRLNPDTGEGMPDNPLAFSADPNARRIIAYGLRNPFRFTIRPGTNELWLGDVGWDTFEEINRISAPADTVVDNFGWPCYEGDGRQAGYDSPNLNICENLYAAGPGAVSSPTFTYNHASTVVTGESCPTGSSSVSGAAFYGSGAYPAAYNGALFFADYSRKCIWVVPMGTNGQPDFASRATFVAGAAGPVDLQIGPGGDLFYADFDGGTIRRVSYTGQAGSTDKALGRPASASSVEKAGLEASMGNDGSSLTRWSSAFADGEWWQVDLGQPRQIDAVQINWESAYASTYRLLTSLDGTTFTTAAEQTLTAPTLQTTSFTPRTARYLRIHCLTRATTYGCSFWDAHVYGPPDTTPTDTTPPTVSISAPSPGANLSGTVTVSATAADNIGVLGVQFKLDGANLGAEATSAPYTTSWNTAGAANGQHTLTALARDAAGNQTTSTPITVTVTNSGPEDKALGRPASASSVEKPGLEASMGNDGSSLTRWSSAFADGEWWQVDLGQPRQIDAVQINWESAYASTYRLLTSLDGTTFTTAADQTLTAPTLQTTSFTPRTARYLRIHCLTRATTYGCSFWDAHVYGPPDTTPTDTTPPTVSISAPSPGANLSGTVTVSATAADNIGVLGVQFKLDGANLGTEATSAPYTTSWNTAGAANGQHTLTALARDAAGNQTTSTPITVTVTNSGPEDKALGRPASASSVEKPGLEASMGNDGSSLTRWSSAFADGEWWQVDLGQPRQIDAVQINWESAYASTYRLLTSLDGTTFTTAADQTLTAPTLQTTSFTPRTARYLRIHCLTRATTYGCSFWDAHVYGPPDTAPGNTPPSATIVAPTGVLNWSVDDPIAFSGTGSDPEDGTLPASAFAWNVTLQHCPSNCHTHPGQSFQGVKSGSFVAPDHEYPSHLELRLTVTDSGGLTDVETVVLQPRTTTLTFQSDPTGLQLVVGPQGQATPFDRTVIVGSNNSISAPSPQLLSGLMYGFTSWSDGGAATHNIVAPAAGSTLRALFGPVATASSLVAAYGFDAPSGMTAADASGRGNTGTISGATPVAGRYGGALSFDGTNDFVAAADSASLDLAAGMTIEAWVLPTGLQAASRPAIFKNASGGAAYSLYANGPLRRPFAQVLLSSRIQATGTGQLPANTWSHLAATYDGATLRLYVNGAQVASFPGGGTIASSTGELRIGGTNVLNHWFRGSIDEVRIYDRALSAGEIQTDMSTPIGS